MRNDVEFFHEELKRVSEWIKFADQKIAFLAVYYSALFGFVAVNKDLVIQRLLSLDGRVLNAVLFVIFLGIISFSIGIVFIISTVFPRLKNGLTNESLFYYGTVSSMKFVDFKKKMSGLPIKGAKEQIIEQVYTNSVVADQKMKGVKNGVICLLVLTFSVAFIYLFSL